MPRQAEGSQGGRREEGEGRGRKREEGGRRKERGGRKDTDEEEVSPSVQLNWPKAQPDIPGRSGRVDRGGVRI
jgi:hypothetical protein